MSRIGRIRSIKPEFFSSPSTAVASPLARLLYIAMWTFADDAGHGEWNPATLMGYAFPNEEMTSTEKFLELLHEVHMAYDVTFYRRRGRRYYEIPTWTEHQRTGGRKSMTHAGPDDAESAPDPEFLSTSVDVPELSGHVPDTDGISRDLEALEQGNRGTGEQGNERRTRKRATNSNPEDNTEFMEFWEAYGHKVDRHSAYQAWLKVSHATPQAVIDGARRYVAWLNAQQDPPAQKYAATFLNKRSWEDEYKPPRGRQLVDSSAAELRPIGEEFL